MTAPQKQNDLYITKNIENHNQDFWNNRWLHNETGWDIGHASPPIMDYMTQYINKDTKILIPGCGSAYEAEKLVLLGFQNITLIDISEEAVARLKRKFKDTNQVRVFCEDFFKHQESYDLIIEQTFFCAIPPNKRNDYVKKTNSLLKDGGKLMGVLFDKEFDKQGPPFGGSKNEYISTFEKYFTIKTIEKCYNSIDPRKDSEVFMILIKK